MIVYVEQTASLAEIEEQAKKDSKGVTIGHMVPLSKAKLTIKLLSSLSIDENNKPSYSYYVRAKPYMPFSASKTYPTAKEAIYALVTQFELNSYYTLKMKTFTE